MLRLSQRHLNLLETCPPKFKQLYISQDNLIPNPENEERQVWGCQFHLLMQQRELGLPIDSILTTEKELAASLEALIKEVPELSTRQSKGQRAAEHYRTLSINDYLLSVIYDLVIAQEDKAQILDWKTYLQPKTKTNLAQNWQTRLYLYVLAETSDYTPEQISMTYWFVKLPKKPQSHTFQYSKQLHQQTKQDLTALLTNLDTWLLETSQSIFPHRSQCESKCSYFEDFRDENLRSDNNSNDLDELTKEIDKIVEIPI